MGNREVENGTRWEVEIGLNRNHNATHSLKTRLSRYRTYTVGLFNGESLKMHAGIVSWY